MLKHLKVNNYQFLYKSSDLLPTLLLCLQQLRHTFLKDYAEKNKTFLIAIPLSLSNMLKLQDGNLNLASEVGIADIASWYES